MKEYRVRVVYTGPAGLDIMRKTVMHAPDMKSLVRSLAVLLPNMKSLTISIKE